MSAIGNELERLHKQIESVMCPFTLMISRRTYSPRLLKEVAAGLENSAKEIKEFLEK